MALWAVRDAPPAPGRFPVVIYAPSFSAMSWENADLCEYLASHGYVVMASPDMGATSREMTADLAGINAQAGDISFLIGYAQTLPNTDMSAVAVAGFSWGGISNLFAAARDNRIHALVALDGSMRYFPGLVKQAGDVHPEQMTIPLLYFAQGEITLEDQARYFTDAGKNEGPSVLNPGRMGISLPCTCWGWSTSSTAPCISATKMCGRTFLKRHKGDYEREDGIIGYAWIARYTLQFLDAYLKHEAAAMAYLKRTPAENGAPKHFMTVSYRAAKGVPASLEAFRSELGRQGFDHAADVYAAMRKEKSDFKLDETAVNSWGYELMADNHFPEAIELLQAKRADLSRVRRCVRQPGRGLHEIRAEQLSRRELQEVARKDPDERKRQGEAEGVGGQRRRQSKRSCKTVPSKPNPGALESTPGAEPVPSEAWDAIPDPLLAFDTRQQVVFVNAEAARYLSARGLPQDCDALCKAIKVCDAETQAILTPAQLPVARALRGEATDRIEYLVRPAPHGTSFWVECGARPFYGQAGEIGGAVLVFRDITVRKKRELARDSSAQLRDFIYQGNVAGILHTTVDGRILDCNDAIARMFGYSSEEVAPFALRNSTTIPRTATGCCAAWWFRIMCGSPRSVSAARQFPLLGADQHTLVRPAARRGGRQPDFHGDRHYRAQILGGGDAAQPAEIRGFYALSSRDCLHQGLNREVCLLQRSRVGAVSETARGHRGEGR